MLREFGTDLKKLREIKGISIAEISAESRINPKFLQNIENGIFDFQPETYIRSFIKAYARALDENENQILNDYDKAKAGFYARRKFGSDDTGETTTGEEKIRILVSDTAPEKPAEPIFPETVTDDKPDYMKPKSYEEEDDKSYSGKSVTQKILLVILILAIAAGIYFLIDYLNSTGDKKTDVKPKSFSEISSDYETRIQGKVDSTRIKDSLKTLAAGKDSLKLMIIALRDIRVKVYIDDSSEPLDEDIDAKDTLVFSAAEKFRFSANANASVEIYLNDKYLKKSNTITGNSIKNLIITKEGIVTE